MPWARGGFWPAIPMGSSVAMDAVDTGSHPRRRRHRSTASVGGRRRPLRVASSRRGRERGGGCDFGLFPGSGGARWRSVWWSVRARAVGAPRLAAASDAAGALGVPRRVVRRVVRRRQRRVHRPSAGRSLCRGSRVFHRLTQGRRSSPWRTRCRAPCGRTARGPAVVLVCDDRCEVPSANIPEQTLGCRVDPPDHSEVIEHIARNTHAGESPLHIASDTQATGHLIKVTVGGIPARKRPTFFWVHSGRFSWRKKRGSSAPGGNGAAL